MSEVCALTQDLSCRVGIRKGAKFHDTSRLIFSQCHIAFSEFTANIQDNLWIESGINISILQKRKLGLRTCPSVFLISERALFLYTLRNRNSMDTEHNQ